MKKAVQTEQEKLYARKIKRPPMFIYQILGYIWKLIFVKKYNVHFNYKIDVKKFKGPYIVISNHASRVDYLYTGVAFLPHRLNYVAGYNEFFRSHLAGVFRLLQVIPKKNFTPEVYSIKEFARIIRDGGKVILFPEGMSSIGGGNQPAAIGTGHLLKHFKVPVLMTHIEGGYLTNPKYDLADRPGRVDVTISQLFTPEQLTVMTDEEIQLAVDRAIHHDDYEWNKTARVAFNGKGQIAKNLHHLLYWCPKCHSEFTMKGEGNTIRCSHCGNGATVNEYYDLIPFDENCVIPKTQTEWFDLERKNAYWQVREENFALREHVRLAVLPKYEYLKDLKTGEVVGEGEIVLDHNGLTYTGTKNNEPFTFHMPTDLLPTYGMCTDVGFFTTYCNGEYYEFYPEHEVTGKWLHATEEMHRFNGGKWKNFPWADFSEK